MKFQLVCDSSCDLGKNYVEKHNVEIVPLSVSYDGETYYRDGIDIDSEEFFKTLVDNPDISPKSTLPQIQEYVDVFEKYVKEGMPVICATITIKFSGSYNAACMAKSQVLENYPKAVIEVVDSTLNTVCFGLFANEVVKMRDAGLDIQQALTHIEEIKKTGNIFFTIGSFTYLNKGGRLGKAALTAGDKLGIKPIIIMNNGGISVGGVKRSRKKALEKVLEITKEYFDNPDINKDDYNIYIGYCFDKEEALEFEKEVEEMLGVKMCTDLDGTIGVVSGVHTGPYALGLAFVKRYDA